MGDVPDPHLEDLGSTLIIARWTISYSGEGRPRRWFHVFVYDTLEAMHLAAAKYDRSMVAFEADALGLVQESPITYDDDDEHFTGPMYYTQGGFSGVVRLTKENLRLEIVLHEAIHAACIIYRRMYDRELVLGDGFGSIEGEERFAYIYGHIAEHMILALDDIAERI